jgi:hypothetical protein
MRLAKDTLSHAIPTGDDAAILARAFDALLEKLAKQKFAATEKPVCLAGTRRSQARTPRPRSSAPCGFVTSGVAATSVRTAIGATSAASWSSTTRTRVLSAARRVFDLIELRCRRPQRLRREAVFRVAPPDARTRSGTS